MEEESKGIQAQRATHPYLHASIRIGTCKGPINFKSRQRSFLKSDIPVVKLKRKEDVLEWKRSKILSGEVPWNSTAPCILKPVIEHRQKENYVKDRSNAYQYNYRAETLEPLRIDEPIDKPTKFHVSHTSSEYASKTLRRMTENPIQRGTFRRTEELPINSSLTGKPEWNLNTSFDRKGSERNLEKFTEKSLQFTKKINQKLDTMEYKGPRKSEVIYAATLRRQKTAGTFVPASFMDGADRSPIDKATLVNRNAIEPRRVFTATSHSGVWELSKIDNRYIIITVSSTF
jgi:hypothetical protein